MINLKQLKESEFFRHVATLTAGTFLAQLITVMITPVLSRLYTPADYAVFAIFTSIVSQVAVGASLRLEMALPTIKDDGEALQLLRLAAKIIFIVSGASIVGSAAFVLLKGNEGYKFIYLLIPIGIFLTASIQLLNFFSSRIKLFKLNSISRITLSAITAGCSAVFGLFSFKENGLILGFLLGLMGGAIILFYPLLKGNRIHADFENQNFSNKELFKKYKSYVWVNTPHALIDTLEVSGILLLMNKHYSKEEVGSYFFAYRLLKLPVSLIGAAVFQVFYQRIAYIKNSGGLIAPIVRKVYIQMALIGLPVFSLIMLLSERLFPFIFGDKWMLAGILSSIMTPWLFFNFLASSVSSVTFVLNKQKPAFYIAITDLTLRLGVLYFFGNNTEFKQMIYYLTIISSLVMLFNCWWYHLISSKYDERSVTA